MSIGASYSICWKVQVWEEMVWLDQTMHLLNLFLCAGEWYPMGFFSSSWGIMAIVIKAMSRMIFAMEHGGFSWVFLVGVRNGTGLSISHLLFAGNTSPSFTLWGWEHPMECDLWYLWDRLGAAISGVELLTCWKGNLVTISAHLCAGWSYCVYYGVYGAKETRMVSRIAKSWCRNWSLSLLTPYLIC